MDLCVLPENHNPSYVGHSLGCLGREAQNQEYSLVALD